MRTKDWCAIKRSLLTTVVMVGLFGLVASATAGQKNGNHSQESDRNSQKSQSFTQKLGKGLSGDDVAKIVSNFKKKDGKHHHEPKPLDPGRPDDRVPVEPVTPPTRPGFVWVDGHWERERAPKTPKIIVDQAPDSVGPVVRDHRTTSQPIIRDHRTSSAPIIRDHRTPVSVFDAPKNQGPDAAPWSGIPVGPVIRDHRTTSRPITRDHRTTTGPVVRDHRSESSQGGVSVTTTTRTNRDNTITGSGPNPLESALDGLSTVGNLFGIGYGEVTSGTNGSRDHRTPPPKPIVRDHR